MKKRFLAILVCMALVVPAILFASVNDDQVTSIKLKEADGTSAQNTNSGSGVKTGHIQDGAVTDAKISGTISASKIATTGLNADLLDGNHASDFTNADQTLQANIDALTALVNTQAGQIATLQAQLTVLNNNDAVKIGALGYIKLNTSVLNNVVGPHILFEGVNVHVRDGGENTGQNRQPTGLGNLIIGYNEYNYETGGGENEGDRIGIHNLIMGMGHIFKGYGNIAHGWGASLLGSNSAAIASDTNIIKGSYAASLSGYLNIIDGNSVAVGGLKNYTYGGVSVSGSDNTLSSAFNSAIIGGRNNMIGGDPYVTGHTANVIIIGGENNTVTNAEADVGGNLNRFSTVIGVSNMTIMTDTAYVDGD